MKLPSLPMAVFSSCVALTGFLALSVTGCRTLDSARQGDSKKGGRPTSTGKATALDWNEAVIRAVEKLPIGGGYSVRSDAREALQSAVAWEDGKPAIRPAAAQPSFCSGATYLVFMILLAQEQRAGNLTLTPEVWRKLIVEGQPDGQGVWGRWNSNGPGMARLFHELGLGRNFTDWKQARPGDFLKVFWNDAIGSSEKGHSVVFVDRGVVDGEDTVTFWSSNQPGGYGVRQVPFRNIKRAVFSRLEHPDRVSGVLAIPEEDSFLATLAANPTTPEVAAKACGLRSWE